MESPHHDSPELDSDSSSQRRRWPNLKSVRRRWLLLVLLFVIGATASIAWRQWLNGQRLLAQRAVTRNEWNLALDILDRYLRYRPDDAEARLLIAQACVSVAKGEKSKNLQRAVFHLQQISNTSPSASRARLQEARISLLLLKKPQTAERLLKDSLLLDKESPEANLLMWQLLDMTGRHVYSDTYFWKGYELSPSSQRGPLLRDWFLSEFYPDQLYSAMYRQMGITAVGTIPASVNLMVQFREIEPSAGFLHAAIARHFHGAGNLKGAIDLLNECPDVAAAMSDPFFVSVLFETLIDLGEFQKAEDCFKEFPKPHDGYLFLRSEGMYYDYVLNDNPHAVESYRKALKTIPARFDWGLMTRLSVCLKKTGRITEGEQVQADVEHLTRQVLTLEHTSLLRNLLATMVRPEDATRFIDFYRNFGLEQEVAAWTDYQNDLEKIH